MYRLRLLEIKSLRSRLASFTHPTALNEPQKALVKSTETYPTILILLLSLVLSLSLSLSPLFISFI